LVLRQNGIAAVVGIGAGPTEIDAKVAAVGPAQLLQALHEDEHERLFVGIGGGERHQHADAAHALTLLRPRRERPCHRRAAEQRDELAPSQVEHGFSFYTEITRSPDLHEEASRVES
jgi:hypothetical protein